VPYPPLARVRGGSQLKTIWSHAMQPRKRGRPKGWKRPDSQPLPERIPYTKVFVEDITWLGIKAEQSGGITIQEVVRSLIQNAMDSGFTPSSTKYVHKDQSVFSHSLPQTRVTAGMNLWLVNSAKSASITVQDIVRQVIDYHQNPPKKPRRSRRQRQQA